MASPTTYDLVLANVYMLGCANSWISIDAHAHVHACT